MSAQEKMKAALDQIKIPSYEIKVYGSRFTVECLSMKAATSWAALVAKFATVQAIKESLVEAKGSHSANEPAFIRVYRVYALA